MSVGEHDNELATLVGHVVLEATTLDYWICHLVATVLGDGPDQWRCYWGQTGQALIDGLERAGQHDERLARLVAPTKSVVLRRNQVVHGLWFLDPERGPGAYEIARPIRKSDDSDERAVSLADLHQLRTDIRRLDDYVYVVLSTLRPLRQYGTGELVERTQLILPSLDEIVANASWDVSAGLG